METSEKKTNNNAMIMRIAYALFIALSVYHIFYNKAYIDAASTMGIALIFDPFDPLIPWDKRPIWQRGWLIVHLGIAAALFGYGISLTE